MTNKVLITGANKGIGFETARQLANQGWYILLGARNLDRGREAVQKLNHEGIHSVELIEIDLNDLNTITTAAGYVVQKHPDLKAVINNAGIPGDMEKRPLDFDTSELDELMKVNVYGNFQMIKQFTPILAKNHGKILNLTIPLMVTPFFKPFGYMTSKSALNTMIKLVGSDYKQHKIPVEVYGVIPGGVSTDLNDHMSGWMMHSVTEGGKIISDALLDSKNHQGKIINKTGVIGLGAKQLWKKLPINKNK